MSYTVTEFGVFLLPLDVEANATFIHDDSQSDDMLLGHPWFPYHWPQRSRVQEGMGVDVRLRRDSAQLYSTMQQSDSGLLLCQINIDLPLQLHLSLLLGGRERPCHLGAATILIHPR